MNPVILPYKNISHFKELLDSKYLAFLRIRGFKVNTSQNTNDYIITILPYTFDLEDIKPVTTVDVVAYANPALIRTFVAETL